jgi:WD40 repeat protein
MIITRNSIKWIKETRILALFLAMASCSVFESPSPTQTIIPPADINVSSTKTIVITSTNAMTKTINNTVTLSPYPTVSYPLKPRPIIKRDNAELITLLGTVPEVNFGGLVGSQLAWSPDSKQIAITTNGEGIRIIDPLVMREIGEIKQNREGIIDSPGGIAYSPDGKILAVSIPSGKYSNPGNIAFYDTSTYEKVRDDLPSYGAYVIKYSHNGNWLAYGGFMGGEVVDLDSGEQIYKFVEYNVEFYSVQFSWDDKYFMAAGNGYSSVLVNTETWNSVYELNGNTCFSPDNKYFAKEPGIWEIESNRLVKGFEVEYFIGLCDFGKQGDILINSESGVGIEVWDVNTGELINLFLRMTIFGPFYNMALSPDGRIIAIMDRQEKAISFWGIPIEEDK